MSGVKKERKANNDKVPIVLYREKKFTGMISRVIGAVWCVRSVRC